jgi:TRAP-type C4-dicarboxylate transport system substrate-binding protein
MRSLGPRLAAAASLAALMLCGTSATAQVQMRYAVGFPSGAPVEGARLYADAVKKHTDNTVNVRVFDTALLSLPEMSAGVAKGIAEIGYLVTPYWPAEYPHTNMASELSMMLALRADPEVRDGLVYAGAFAEFVLFNCPECVADFAKQNQVFTASAVSPPYTLQCTKPIRTLADLKGARLRVGGAAWSRWARQVGASPVSMPGNEMFEALKQKVVDCTVLAAAELSAWNLREVVSDFNPDLPGGVFSGSALNVNRDAWRKLTDAQRAGLMRAASVMTAEATFRYRAYSRRDAEQFAAKGGRVHKADPELLKASRAAIEQDIPGIAAAYAKQHGVKRADALVEAMKPLIAKWTTLVANVDNAEALADLYWREIYSKVDVKTYGMQ